MCIWRLAFPKIVLVVLCGSKTWTIVDLQCKNVSRFCSIVLKVSFNVVNDRKEQSTNFNIFWENKHYGGEKSRNKIVMKRLIFCCLLEACILRTESTWSPQTIIVTRYLKTTQFCTWQSRFLNSCQLSAPFMSCFSKTFMNFRNI